MKARNPFATVIAIAITLLSTVVTAGEPSEWYQDLLWHKSDPSVMPEGTPPSGTVTLKGRSIAVLIGRVSGEGAIDFHGKKYRFKLSSISFFDIGAATIAATGEVYNLTAIGDLAGRYTALTAGATIARGGSIAYLRNERGVIMRLRSSDGGLRFNVSMGRVKITVSEI